MKQVEELFRIVCKVNCKREFSGTYRRLNSLIFNKLYSGHLAAPVLLYSAVYIFISEFNYYPVSCDSFRGKEQSRAIE